ncbi:hypothetical protein RRG08_027487 [Elysia crispata]|uniref:Uncharacterized protein n=1 Tax=Elysia crispata TaxID=231223 RepID=A0AAE0YRV6_9GAST|nr:hypothetical protein RRG08_027487 [Elysia crispata]
MCIRGSLYPGHNSTALDLRPSSTRTCRESPGLGHHLVAPNHLLNSVLTVPSGRDLTPFPRALSLLLSRPARRRKAKPSLPLAVYQNSYDLSESVSQPHWLGELVLATLSNSKKERNQGGLHMLTFEV